MKKRDLRTRELFQNGFSGIAWIAIGASRIWGNNIIISILVIAFIVRSLAVNVMSYIAKRREVNNDEYMKNADDEQEGFEKVEEDAECVYKSYFPSIGIILCLIITSIKNTWSVDLNIVIPILIGSILLIRDIQSIFYNKTNC